MLAFVPRSIVAVLHGTVLDRDFIPRFPILLWHIARWPACRNCWCIGQQRVIRTYSSPSTHLRRRRCTWAIVAHIVRSEVAGARLALGSLLAVAVIPAQAADEPDRRLFCVRSGCR